MDDHEGLRVPPFPFDSPLAAKAVALERRRGDLPRVAESQPLLPEIGELQQLISSIVSARIEGNHTTVVDAIDGAQLREEQPSLPLDDSIEEILHLQAAADFLDDVIASGSAITHSQVRELHLMVTRGLRREGDPHPGAYRTEEVAIQGSAHHPPLASTVHAYMSDLLDFANAPADPQFQLIRMAIAHHRFVWIHPFTNGNGRVARLFSYAMLRAYGFAPEVGYKTVNPTTVFGADRRRYYERLAAADSLEDDAIIEWADFVLEGLLRDMTSIAQLSSGTVLPDLVARAVDRAGRSGVLSPEETAVMRIGADGRAFKSGDLVPATGLAPSPRSRLLSSMLERRLIGRLEANGRIYRIRLTPNPLTSFLIGELAALGMLPEILSDDPNRPA
ncbi:Fic family protein [Brachybacterium sp. NBEC-018]|uniref:Fic family protein n=1 Tax=Brachybacterium sp. NBEC-018 TaxID=2996004 RepID=UPI00217551BE|nr:Fic family protein [Brachybacterium sp. NBEC-018]UVY84790.1 Fic family protein [Brachybacterium sp. NBEC-018]